jgi:hypothetical protein
MFGGDREMKGTDAHCGKDLIYGTYAVDDVYPTVSES